MSSWRLSCPHCNHQFLLPTLPESGKTVCPRCDELMPTSNAIESAETADQNPVGDQEPTEQGSSLLFTIVAGSALTISLLSIGLVIFFFVQSTDRPPEQADPNQQPTVSTWPPMVLPSLAYLPSSTNVIMAVQPRAMLGMAEQAGYSADEVWRQFDLPGDWESMVDSIGLKPDQINQLTLGLTVAKENPLPKGVFLLILAKPLDNEAELLKKLEASRFVPASGQARYKLTLAGFPAEMTKANDTTYVFSTDGDWLEQDWDQLKARGTGHLSQPIRTAIEKLSPAATAWIATGEAEWSETAVVQLGSAVAKQPEWPKQLQGLRAIAAGMSFEPEPTLVIKLLLQDGQNAERPAIASRLIGPEGQWEFEDGWHTGRRVYPLMGDRSDKPQ